MTRNDLSPQTRSPAQRVWLVLRGLWLEYATLAWNVVGVGLVVWAAVLARSVALAGFGLDSLIEVFASVIVVWQLTGVHHDRERTALRLIGGAFVHWRVYGDEGLAGTQAGVLLAKETRTLTLAYDASPVAQYAVTFAPDEGKAEGRVRRTSWTSKTPSTKTGKKAGKKTGKKAGK